MYACERGCGPWSPLRFSSSPCFLLSGVCRRGRGEKSSLEACRYVEDSGLFRHLDGTRGHDARSRTLARHGASCRSTELPFRNVVTHGLSFLRARAMTQAKLYSAFDKVIRDAPLRPSQAPGCQRFMRAVTRVRAFPSLA